MVKTAPMRRLPNRPRGPMKRPVFVPRHPFDQVLAENFFPKVDQNQDDTALTNALVKKNQDLTPSQSEQTSIANLVSKVQAVLDNLVVAPGENGVALEEVRVVGSFKKGTMIAGNNVADFVAILKVVPTNSVSEALSKKVSEELKNAMKTEVVTKADAITVSTNERGFDIFNWQARVRVLLTTIPQNLRKQEGGDCLDFKLMHGHLAAIRHARWFEENAHHSSIKVLIRILRDISKRFDGFESLNPYIIDLLAHSVIINNPSRQALPINLAFRRVFQLLASGLFLPGSSGIGDPCEPNHNRVHTALTLEQQDLVCMTAQTLLRVLCHGGFNRILWNEGSASIAKEMSVWDGVVVFPLDIAYEKSENDKKDDTEDMEQEMIAEAEGE